MGAEERGLVGELPGDRQTSGLIMDGEAVAALDLDGGGSLAHHLPDEAGDLSRELLIGCGPGCGDCAPDSPGRVGLARHPGRELGGPITGEDQVTVTVHEPRQYGASARVVRRVSGRRGGSGADPGDVGTFDDHGRVMDDSQDPVAHTASNCGSLVTSSPMFVMTVETTTPSQIAAIAASRSRPICSESPRSNRTRPSIMTRVTSAAQAAKTAE